MPKETAINSARADPIRDSDEGGSASEPSGLRRTSPLRILVADDNMQLGEVLVQYFALAGHTAEHAADGMAAWEKVSKDVRHFDVVITDNNMPELNGLELVELLREADYKGRIIVYTSALTSHESEKYRELKVDRILSKGSDAAAVLSAVEALRYRASSQLND